MSDFLLLQRIVDPVMLDNHVFYVHVHKNIDRMADHKDEWTTEEFAHTNVEDGKIIIHLSKDYMELSLVAHEATHAVLWSMDRAAWPKSGKKMKLFNHPEEVAKLIGNLTALIWYSNQPKAADEEFDLIPTANF